MRKIRKRKIRGEIRLARVTHHDRKYFNTLSQLWDDQNGRCYLCERNLSTDFELDHFYSKAKYPELRASWQNHFLACKYCNGKKSWGFMPLLRPDKDEVDKEIKQRWIPMENRFEIRRCGDTLEHRQTERLLESIYNGDGKMCDFRMMRFRDDIVMRLNRFCRHLLRAFQRGDVESMRVLNSDLSPTSELLTLKESLLRDIG